MDMPIDNGNEKNCARYVQMDADWLYYVALALWCIGQIFCVSLLSYVGLYTWEDLINAKFACLVLLLLREAVLLGRSVRCAFGSAPRSANDLRGGFQALLADAYIRELLVSLPVFVLLFIGLKANMNGAWPQYLLLFVFCARSLDFHKAVRVAGVAGTTALVVVFGAALCGLVPNIFTTLGHTGWCLGFDYPLYPAAVVMNITLCLLVSMSNRVDWRVYAALATFNLLIFLLSRARIAFGATELAIALCAAWSWRRTHKIMERFAPVLVASMLVVCAISFMTALLYDGTGILARLNSALGGRISQAHEAFYRFSVTPFGQQVDMRGNGGLELRPENADLPYFYIDNYFIQLLMKHGVVAFVAVIGAYTLASWRAWKAGDWALLACIAATAVFMFFDDHSMTLQCNALMLCLWPRWNGAGAN